MLWDVVYEFFVKYIFGGAYFGDYYGGLLGDNFYSLGGNVTDDGFNTYNVAIKIGLFDNSYFMNEGALIDSLYMPLGNYLSLIATIISMVVIVVLACLFIKKIYNMVAHIIA